MYSNFYSLLINPGTLKIRLFSTGRQFKGGAK
jgi:hypothetical protein